jgi:hypothetical protein
VSTAIQRAEPQNKAAVVWDEQGPKPQTMEETFRLAQYFHAAGLCANSYKCVEHYMIAIWAGQAIGVPPVQAVQGMAIVNGRAMIWGDLMMALVMRSGKLVDHAERFEGSGTDITAICSAKRMTRGDDDTIRIVGTSEHRFSWKDAERAGLTAKDPWRKYPQRMLMWRARTYVMRDLFADVLGGLDIADGMQADTPVKDAGHITMVERASDRLAMDLLPPSEQLKPVEIPTTPEPKPQAVTPRASPGTMFDLSDEDIDAALGNGGDS